MKLTVKRLSSVKLKQQNKTIIQKDHDFHKLDKTEKQFLSPCWRVWSDRFFYFFFLIQVPHLKGFIYIAGLDMADPA